MNKRDAKKEGLISVAYYGSTAKDEAKKRISEIRQQYKGKGVRVVLVTSSSGSGYNKCVSYYIYTNKIGYAYLNKNKLEKRIDDYKLVFNRLQEEYNQKVLNAEHELKVLQLELNELNEIIEESL